MEFGTITQVKETHRRDAIYIPKHKNWVELSKETNEEDGVYTYEVVRLDWQDEFTEDYLEENFDTLYVKPDYITYDEPEQTEEEMEG